ncbi:MAG: hypothetical protein UT24_C0038G0016 [Candidatus Woesebacteria bacterium GW2011_GWB1_39_12]|uniref:Prophage protein n=1 Tax=Candidatus Woesebacteria bacterium GW2011_GWB1_39_12 TaxID=1618574 RepID=A0A0G0PJV5_9BACT|nr:MAG: hypothetical protein UT24_C0038G0016 [Candidatus Woesebacteria bacterium GW2011_GWB1_39_12]
MNFRTCTKCKKEKLLSEENFAFYSGKYEARCKECRKEYHKEHYQKVKHKISKRRSEHHKKYWLENKETLSEQYKIYWKSYYEKNKEKKIQYQVDYKREQRKDPAVRMRNNVSGQIRNALKKNKTSKNSPTWSKLPYTPLQLKEHLEKQFDSNMTWGNYGSYWHIDHVIPQSLLLYDSMEHPNFIKCWSLSNLQPLEAKENMSKGNKTS